MRRLDYLKKKLGITDKAMDRARQLAKIEEISYKLLQNGTPFEYIQSAIDDAKYWYEADKS